MASGYGITGFGIHIPRLRMQRGVIAEAHRWMAPALRSQAKGRRAFCNWDEDSVTLGVEAARDALYGRSAADFGALWLTSTTMPFADFQNSAVIAGALSLPADIQALDLAHSQRGFANGLLAALRQAGSSALFISTDRPRAKPASVQEIGNGAGAAAFTLGGEGVIATLQAASSRTALFVDHFRAAGASYDYAWEERWIREEGYLRLVAGTVRSALAEAGIAAADVNHFILPSPLRGIATAVARTLGISAEAEADPLHDDCGYCGGAHGALMLAAVLESAGPGECIVVAGLGQGADALVLRTTEAIKSFHPRRSVSAVLADSLEQDSYLRLAAHEDSIELEWGMRAEKSVKTALTEQYRSDGQIGGFVAGRCRSCGTIQFPQLPYCVNPQCKAPRDQFDPLPLPDEPAQLVTYTADWLSYHPAPPLHVGFVQFDHGARVLMEIADVGSEGLEVGMKVRPVFRIKETDRVRGYPHYFWKATPIRD